MRTTVPKEFEVLEKQTTRITALLTEDDGVTPIPGSTLTTLTLTIYDTDADQTVIVAARNILNTNDGAVDEDGGVQVILAPADVPIQNAALPFERHVCLFRWTWGAAPEKAGAHELVLIVRNLAKVT